MYSSHNKIEIRLYVKILFSKSGSQALRETAYFRDDMTVQFYSRWRWYFEYRAALLKVEYPKSFVQLNQGNYEYILPDDELRLKLENKIRAAKGKITEFNRRLTNLSNNWNELFPIEQHPDWTKIVQKNDYYKLQLSLLTTEYESLTKQNHEKLSQSDLYQE